MTEGVPKCKWMLKLVKVDEEWNTGMLYSLVLLRDCAFLQIESETFHSKKITTC